MTFIRGGRIVLTNKSLRNPYAEIVPSYSSELGPHAEIYRLTESGRELILTLPWGDINTLIRWLPLVRSAALRLESKAKKADQDSTIDNVA